MGNRKCESCGSTLLVYGSIAVRCLACGRVQGATVSDEHENGFREGLRLAMQIVRGQGDLAYVPDIVEEIEKCIDPDYEPTPMPDHPEFGPLRERPPCAGSPSCMVGDEGSGTSHGIRCPLFSDENRIAWYRAEIARYRRWLDCAPPWPKTFKPLNDEGLRAIRLRWATGPERYQADADALIFTIAYMQVEHARLLEEAREQGRKDIVDRLVKHDMSIQVGLGDMWDAGYMLAHLEAKKPKQQGGEHPHCKLYTEDKTTFPDCQGDGHHACRLCARRAQS